MANLVKNAGSTEMRENPPVHSKAQHHGIPRTPGKVSKPGGVASLPGGTPGAVAAQRGPDAYPPARNLPSPKSQAGTTTRVSGASKIDKGYPGDK